MTGFEDYTQEMKAFEQSKLFKRLYVRLINKLNGGGKYTSKEMESEYDIKGAQVRKLVNHARRKTLPIVSDSAGYSMARHQGEIMGTIAHLEERSRQMLFVASRLKRAFVQESYQGKLF